MKNLCRGFNILQGLLQKVNHRRLFSGEVGLLQLLRDDGDRLRVAALNFDFFKIGLAALQHLLDVYLDVFDSELGVFLIDHLEDVELIELFCFLFGFFQEIKRQSVATALAKHDRKLNVVVGMNRVFVFEMVECEALFNVFQQLVTQPVITIARLCIIGLIQRLHDLLLLIDELFGTNRIKKDDQLLFVLRFEAIG